MVFWDDVERFPNKITGKWWMPSNKELQISGNLELSSNNRIILKLNGHFARENYPSRSIPEIQILHGTTMHSTQVTLFRSILQSSTSSTRYTTSTYETEIVFFGHHFFSEKDMQFNGLFLKFNQFEKWLGIDPFIIKWNDPDTQEKLIVEYTNPKTLRFDLDNYIMHITHSLGYSSTRYKLNDFGLNSQIDLDFKNWYDFNYVLNVAKHLNNFLSLVMDQNIYAISIIGNTKYNEGEIPAEYYNKGYLKNVLIYHPKLIKKNEGDIYYNDIIPFEIIRHDFAKYLNNWFNFVKEHEPLYELYFSTLYEYDMYPVSEFLALTQGLDAYLPKHQSIKIKLERILSAYSYISPSITNNINMFIKYVSDSRNYYTHYIKKTENVIPISELIHYSKKLRSIIISIMLQEMGIDKELIIQISSRFPPLEMEK